jgi:hypothetical protein
MAIFFVKQSGAWYAMSGQELTKQANKAKEKGLWDKLWGEISDFVWEELKQYLVERVTKSSEPSPPAKPEGGKVYA